MTSHVCSETRHRDPLVPYCLTNVTHEPRYGWAGLLAVRSGHHRPRALGCQWHYPDHVEPHIITGHLLFSKPTAMLGASSARGRLTIWVCVTPTFRAPSLPPFHVHLLRDPASLRGASPHPVCTPMQAPWALSSSETLGDPPAPCICEAPPHPPGCVPSGRDQLWDDQVFTSTF